MATGDSYDILSRIKRVIPGYWFNSTAPYFTAVVGGLSDSAAFCYSLITYAQKQARIATATGPFLDMIAYDYLGRFLKRRSSSDSVFRARIKATVLQERVTRKGMINAVTMLVGNAPVIFEPWNTFDTGGYGVSGGYGVAGGWGNMNLPGQVFIHVTPGPDAGAPNVGGYSNYPGGYGVGAVEYAGASVEQAGVPKSDIYALIVATKPTGVTAWTNIGAPKVAPQFAGTIAKATPPNNLWAEYYGYFF